MRKNSKSYREIEYGITDLSEGKWKWAFYPKKGIGQSQRGEIMGTQEQAKLACQKAIDTWLDDKNSN